MAASGGASNGSPVQTRPLKRALRQEIENPLAAQLLDGEFPEGSTIKVDAEGGEILFLKETNESGARRSKRPWQGPTTGGDEDAA